MSKNAYSYIRFSSEKQKMGDSVRRQMENTRQYCAAKGMNLIEAYDFKDLGVSAYKSRNLIATPGKKAPAFLRFMELCESGEIPPGSALVVENLDRISRADPWEAIGLLIKIRNLGIEIHMTMTDDVIYPASTNYHTHGERDSDDKGLIAAVMGAVAAHKFSAKNADRLRKAFNEKRKAAAEGKALVSKSVPWWLEIKDNKIVAVPERVKIVKKIFTWTAEGWSSQRIARRLNADRVPTWRRLAKEWQDSRIRDLIRQDHALGDLTPTHKSRVAGGLSADYRFKYYPEIVSWDLAIKARAAMKQNTVIDRTLLQNNELPINLFKGLLRHNGRWCAHQVNQNGTRSPDGIKGFNSYYIEYNHNLENQVAWSIAANQLEPVLIAGLVELTPEDLLPSATKAPKRSLLLRKQVFDLETQVNHVVEAITVAKTSKALAAKLPELEAKLESKRLEFQATEMQEARGSKAVVATNLREISPDLRDPKLRHRTAIALQRLIQRIDVADSINQLPVRETSQKVKQHKGYMDSRAVRDPVPLKSKRRRPLAMLVTFRGGGLRLIIRTKTPLIMSARYQASPEE